MPDLIQDIESDAKTLANDLLADALPVLQPIFSSLLTNLFSGQPSVIGAEEQGVIALNQFMAAQPTIWGALAKQAEALIGGQVQAYIASISAPAASAAPSAGATGATGATGPAAA